VTLQAGAYGEHRFTDVTRGDGADRDCVDVDDHRLEVMLAPGATARLELGTRCYVNDPTYAFPWTG
jgi:hypothetical protein